MSCTHRMRAASRARLRNCGPCASECPLTPPSLPTPLVADSPVPRASPAPDGALGTPRRISSRGRHLLLRLQTPTRESPQPQQAPGASPLARDGAGAASQQPGQLAAAPAHSAGSRPRCRSVRAPSCGRRPMRSAGRAPSRACRCGGGPQTAPRRPLLPSARRRPPAGCAGPRRRRSSYGPPEVPPGCTASCSGPAGTPARGRAGGVMHARHSPPVVKPTAAAERRSPALAVRSPPVGVRRPTSFSCSSCCLRLASCCASPRSLALTACAGEEDRRCSRPE